MDHRKIEDYKRLFTRSAMLLRLVIFFVTSIATLRRLMALCDKRNAMVRRLVKLAMTLRESSNDIVLASSVMFVGNLVARVYTQATQVRRWRHLATFPTRDPLMGGILAHPTRLDRVSWLLRA